MTEEQQRVTIDRIDIGFFAMVWLLVKFVLAAIPAAIIATVIIAVLLALSGALALIQ